MHVSGNLLDKRLLLLPPETASPGKARRTLRGQQQQQQQQRAPFTEEAHAFLSLTFLLSAELLDALLVP